MSLFAEINIDKNLCYEYKMFQIIDNLINSLSDHKIYNETMTKLYNIVENINTVSMEFVLTVIYKNFLSTKWQVKNGALELLNFCAKNHRKIISYYIPDIIENLIVMSNDIKKEIKSSVKICFESVAKTIDNVDIIQLIPYVIGAYLNPSNETQNALDKTTTIHNNYKLSITLFK